MQQVDKELLLLVFSLDLTGSNRLEQATDVDAVQRKGKPFGDHEDSTFDSSHGI